MRNRQTTNTRRAAVLASLALVGALAGCAADDRDDEGADAQPTAVQSADATGAAAGPPADADLATTKMDVSLDEAMATAKKSLPDGVVTKIELDHGTAAGWVWKFDLQAGKEQHEVEVSAVDGSVVEDRSDTEDDPAQAVDPTKLTPEDAMSAALELVPGSVHGWTLEWDAGKQRYDVEVVADGAADETDVHVDVDTGTATEER